MWVTKHCACVNMGQNASYSPHNLPSSFPCEVVGRETDYHTLLAHIPAFSLFYHLRSIHLLRPGSVLMIVCLDCFSPQATNTLISPNFDDINANRLSEYRRFLLQVYSIKSFEPPPVNLRYKNLLKWSSLTVFEGRAGQ